MTRAVEVDSLATPERVQQRVILCEFRNHIFCGVNLQVFGPDIVASERPFVEKTEGPLGDLAFHVGLSAVRCYRETVRGLSVIFRVAWVSLLIAHTISSSSSSRTQVNIVVMSALNAHFL